jgi:hypothetical protein
VGISILALSSRMLHHNVNPIETGDNNRIEGSAAIPPIVLPHKDVNVPPIGTGGTMVVLAAMIILFGAATYFTGRLYGQERYIACVVGVFIVVVTLALLRPWFFG